MNQRQFHRRAGQLALASAIGTVILVAIVQLNGGGLRYEPEGETVASVDLLFTDEADGRVGVFNADSGALVIKYEPTEGVFVRGIMRTVARQRRLRDQGAETPVELSLMDNDMLWLSDPVSGVQFYLGAFGPDNVVHFEEILERSGEIRTSQVQQGDRP